MDFYPRRDAQHGQSGAHRGIDVPGGTVPARKEEQVCPDLSHLPRKMQRIRAGGVPCGLHPRKKDAGKSHLLRKCTAHPAGAGIDGDLIPQAKQRGERGAGALVRHRYRAAPTGFRHHLIGSLQSHGAAHPGNRIDHQAQFFRFHVCLQV